MNDGLSTSGVIGGDGGFFGSVFLKGLMTIWDVIREHGIGFLGLVVVGTGGG